MKKRVRKSIIILLAVICFLFLISCKKKTYVVVFDYCYDHIVATQEVKAGECAKKPVTPERERYEFKGWFLDSKYERQYDDSLVISDNTTIFAKWEAINKYYIRYNLNGGSVSEDSLVKEFVDASEVVLPSPKKANYEFEGWYENGIKITTLENKDYFLVAKYTALYSSVSPLIMSPIREEGMVYKDITFKIVGGEELKMDLYLPKLEEGKTTPVLFMFFGGGFVGGDKSQVANEEGSGYIQRIFDYALDNNIAVIIPNYRLSNGNTIVFPYPVEDCLDAIRFCVKNASALGIDVHNIGTIGYSAGAYMALMTAFAQNYFFGDPELKSVVFRVKYVVDLYGPSFYDREDLNSVPLTGKIMLTSFFGSDIFNPKYDYSFCMPSYYVDENKPSVYIVHGTSDYLVPCSQSQKFYNLLLEKNIDAKILLVEGADHMLVAADSNNPPSMSINHVYDKVVEYILETAFN